MRTNNIQNVLLAVVFSYFTGGCASQNITRQDYSMIKREKYMFADLTGDKNPECIVHESYEVQNQPRYNHIVKVYPSHDENEAIKKNLQNLPIIAETTWTSKDLGWVSVVDINGDGKKEVVHFRNSPGIDCVVKTHIVLYNKEDVFPSIFIDYP